MILKIRFCSTCKDETMWESVNTDSPLVCQKCKTREKKPKPAEGFETIACFQAPTDKRHRT